MALPHEVEGFANEASNRLPRASVAEVAAVRRGDQLITRAHLAEIEQRRASADLVTLLAACSRLLDEVEA